MSKLAVRRTKLVESLDRATREAAIIEGLSEIKHFSQIMEFEEDKHTFYFSDIWVGEQPMATTNPEYYKKVMLVKECIFECCAEACEIKTIGETLGHMKTVWNGIISEEFVFQFRNTKEINSFTIIEGRVQKHYLDLNSFMTNKCYPEALNEFAKCDEDMELDRKEQTICKFLASVASASH